ncbi:MAG: DUF6080 domain-containing protein [Prevotella sp.]|jgi:hypothetical protein
MTNPFKIFIIKREERKLSWMLLAFIVILNVLFIYKYYETISPIGGEWTKYIQQFISVSGLDPYTYIIVTDWQPRYEIFRHPLIAIFYYPAYLLNQGLMALTGINCAQFVVGIVVVFCIFYGLLFLYRIFREVIGIAASASFLLTLMTFSMGYMMIISFFPDHFNLSFFMLMLTLYVAGKKMMKHRAFTIWQTFLFFLVLAGTTLTNGVKVFIASLFVNGKRFFRIKNLIFAVALPVLILYFLGNWQYQNWEVPKMKAKREAFKQRDKFLRDSIFTACWNQSEIKDSAIVKEMAKQVIKERMHKKYVHDHSQMSRINSTHPVKKGTILGLTDISINRWQSTTDNLFGESIQLHQNHLLEDALNTRPMFVSYNYWINYIVEFIIVSLFLIGIWFGRKSRFYWLCFSFFAFDMLVHLVLGFGINEIYIMSPHFLFIIPVSIAYIFKRLDNKTYYNSLLALCAFLTLWLFGWNGYLIVSYLL